MKNGMMMMMMVVAMAGMGCDTEVGATCEKMKAGGGGKISQAIADIMEGQNCQQMEQDVAQAKANISKKMNEGEQGQKGFGEQGAGAPQESPSSDEWVEKWTDEAENQYADLIEEEASEPTVDIEEVMEGDDEDICDAVGYEGTCMENMVIYCEGDVPHVLDCSAYGLRCGFNSEAAFYDCVEDEDSWGDEYDDAYGDNSDDWY